MRVALALSALLLTGAVAAPHTPSGWTTLTSKEGRFKVALPEPVTSTHAPTAEAGGTVEQYLYQAKAASGNEYAVSCWDYTNTPRRVLSPTEVDEATEAQRSSLLPLSSSVKKFWLGSVPGRELRVVPQSRRPLTFRLYHSGRRLYSISVQTDGSAAATAEGRAFLDSFRLTP